jgi:hypothetical protein
MGPPLPSTALGIHAFGGPNSSAPSTLEVFVDFTCPFSAKIYWTLKELYNEVQNRVNVVFMPMPQPWHPSSAVVHECFHAACMVNPELTSKLMAISFEHGVDKFGDVPSQNKTRVEMHKEWADIYEVLGVDKEQFMKNLTLPEGKGPNPGVPATLPLKFYVKACRQLNMHVTPTIRLNSITCDSSSSWDKGQWLEFLQPCE